METGVVAVEERVAAAGARFGVTRRLVTRPWIALAGVTAGATAVWGLIAVFAASSPWIFPDELIYSELAKSLALGSVPAVRGSAELGYGLVYPGLISPAWLSTHVVSAYVVARLVNTAVMTSASVPAYLLARRFVSRHSALGVAILTVLVPSMAYVSTLLTEVALYPAFLWALWAMTRAMDRRTAASQLGALVAIAIAFLTKSLMVILIPTYLSAIVMRTIVTGGGWGGLRDDARRFRLTWLILAAGVAGAMLASIATGRSAAASLGSYAVVLHHLGWSRMPRLALDHLSLLCLYVLVVPLLATLTVFVRAGRSRANTTSHLFVALAAPALLWATAAVAAYGSVPVAGAKGFAAGAALRERNVFFVVPLLFIGFAVWTEDKRPRPRWAVPLAIAAGPLLLALFRWSLLPSAANPQDLSPAGLAALPGGDGVKTGIVVALGALAAAMWLGTDSARARALWLLTGCWMLFTAFVAVLIFHGASGQAAVDGRGTRPDWIDRAVGERARVDVLWRERSGPEFAPPRKRQRVVWVNEFYNRSVRTVYSIGARLPFDLPDRRVRERVDHVLVDSSGSPIRAAYLLSPCEIWVDAPVVAVDHDTATVVYRTAGTVKLGGQRVCRIPPPAP